MQFFAWGINKPGVKDQRMAVIHDHWNFIEPYEPDLIARGPVLAGDGSDRTSVLGSIHILEQPSWADAERFVYDEPFASNGLFEKIVFSRFALELDRTQFEFTSNPELPRFFIYCPARDGATVGSGELKAAHETYCAAHDASFVCRGALLTRDGAWNGSVYFMEVPSQAEAETFIEGDPYNVAGLYGQVQVLLWTMGGRRNLSDD
ncbi:MAG: YciI family protein [Rhodospirillales bacterium]|nr:YciI family protein [Rhodospirillales bacterium]